MDSELPLLLALLAICVALVAHLASQNPERWWSRGEWERLTRLRGDDPVQIHWRAVGQLGLGRPEEAIAEVRKLQSRGAAPVLYLNSMVEAQVTAGRYREAVALSRTQDFSADSWLPPERVLVLINVAEALYNLGRWEEAQELLAPLDAAAEGDPLVRSALALQRAWIHGGRGEVPQARAQLESVVRADLPRSYWPEYHFARAFSALVAGDFPAAEAELDTAQALALRASTRRNLLFLRGRVRFAQGDLEGAQRLLAEGAAHPFRSQGADGLLLWGEVLARLGRGEEARAAWALATARDPQSAQAAVAAARLA
ncbi:MAG: hypothetical protein M3Y59_07495 [Myxococcota bacterium]|nr:hypothetical protein [Myxococcota bacterium]